MSEREALTREVARLRKNARDELVVTLATFKTYQLVHLRIWVRNEAGEEIPTKSGFAVQAALIPALRAALVQAETEARAIGWIDEGTPKDRTAAERQRRYRNRHATDRNAARDDDKQRNGDCSGNEPTIGR